MQKFMIIGNSFVARRTNHVGPCIASREHLYMIRRRGQIEPGGLTGGAIGGAIQGFLNPNVSVKEVWTCDVSELPRQVLTDPQWPIRKNEGPVIVIERSQVEQLIHPSFSMEVVFVVDGFRYMISYPFFRGKKVKAYLEATGWNPQWRQKTPREWRKLL